MMFWAGLYAVALVVFSGWVGYKQWDEDGDLIGTFAATFLSLLLGGIAGCVLFFGVAAMTGALG